MPASSNQVIGKRCERCDDGKVGTGELTNIEDIVMRNSDNCDDVTLRGTDVKGLAG